MARFECFTFALLLTLSSLTQAQPAQPSSQTQANTQKQGKPAATQAHDPIPVAEPEPNINFDPRVLADPNSHFRKDFDIVVVINKAVGAETIDVYRYGALVKHGYVSSGLEAVVPDHGKLMFAQTYTGYFTPDKEDISIDHHSSQFNDAHMPYAVFFNGGEATHQAPAGTESLLGHRASHGCVRNTEANAADIFWMVALSGGPFEIYDFNAWCTLRKDIKDAITNMYPNDPDRAKLEITSRAARLLDQCKADANWVALTNLYRAQAIHALQVGATQGLPYQEWPLVPDTDRKTGEPILDSHGSVLTHPGYRALYIVENVPPQPDARRLKITTQLKIADPSLLVSTNHLAQPTRNVELQQSKSH